MTTQNQNSNDHNLNFSATSVSFVPNVERGIYIKMFQTSITNHYHEPFLVTLSSFSSTPTELRRSLMMVIGNFEQLPPCDRKANPLYKNQEAIWNSINSVIYLESSHRFWEDPEWVEILSRLRVRETTQEDLDLINEWCLTNENIELPTDKQTRFNTCYTWW